jgi:hypothetical protein
MRIRHAKDESPVRIIVFDRKFLLEKKISLQVGVP